MNSHIAKYVQKTEALLHELAADPVFSGSGDLALRALRAVLHALRNRLTPEASLQLVAQLPMILKGLYVDGWTLREQPARAKHLIEFIDEVRTQGGQTWDDVFPDEETTLAVIATVFQVVQNHIAEGEIWQISAVLPREIRQVWDDPVSARLFGE